MYPAIFSFSFGAYLWLKKTLAAKDSNIKRNSTKIVATKFPNGKRLSILSNTIFENHVFDTVSTNAVNDIKQVIRINPGDAYFTKSNMYRILSIIFLNFFLLFFTPVTSNNFRKLRDH